MFGRLIGKHLRRRAGSAALEGDAWSDLPSNYADAPRELQSARRRAQHRGHDFPTATPFGYLR
jgi:hypothetical protein